MLAVLLLTGVAVGGVLVLNTRQQTEQRLTDQRARIAELEQKVEGQDGELRSREAAIDQGPGRPGGRPSPSSGTKNPCTAAVQALWDAAKRTDVALVAARTLPMVERLRSAPVIGAASGTHSSSPVRSPGKLDNLTGELDHDIVTGALPAQRTSCATPRWGIQ